MAVGGGVFATLHLRSKVSLTYTRRIEGVYINASRMLKEPFSSRLYLKSLNKN